jgi:hypothetical protein
MARNHAEGHWGNDPNAARLSLEARRRFNLILDFAHNRTERPPPVPEAQGHDTREFWIDQILAGILASAGITIFSDHPIWGSIFLVCGLGWLLYLRWGRRVTRTSLRAPNAVAIFALILAIVIMGYDIYDRHQFVSVGDDTRLAPFTKNNARFFSDLPVDPKESVVVVCYPYDPMSCSIAARYRDYFADHWTPGQTVFDASNPVSLSGIAIVTQSEVRPAGALALRQKFREIGIKAAFPLDPTGIKGANEFAVVIGSNK